MELRAVGEFLCVDAANDILCQVCVYLNGDELSQLLGTCKRMYHFYCHNKLFLWKSLWRNERKQACGAVEGDPSDAFGLSLSSHTTIAARQEIGDLADILFQHTKMDDDKQCGDIVTNPCKHVLSDSQLANIWKYLYLQYYHFKHKQLWNQMNEHILQRKPLVFSQGSSDSIHNLICCIKLLPRFSPSNPLFSKASVHHDSYNIDDIQSEKDDIWKTNQANSSKELKSMRNRKENLTVEEASMKNMLTQCPDQYIFMSSYQSNQFILSHFQQSSGNQKMEIVKTFVGHQGPVLDINPMCRNPLPSAFSTVSMFSNFAASKHGQDLTVYEKNGSSIFQNRVLSSSSDSTIKLWDIQTSSCLSTLNGHSSAVYSIQSSADHSVAVSGSHDKSLRVWDLTTSKCVQNIDAHTDIIYCVRYDGYNTVFSCSKDGSIKAWDLRGNHCLIHVFDNSFELKNEDTLSTVKPPVYCMDLCGYRIVSGDKLGFISLYDLRKQLLPLERKRASRTTFGKSKHEEKESCRMSIGWIGGRCSIKNWPTSGKMQSHNQEAQSPKYSSDEDQCNVYAASNGTNTTYNKHIFMDCKIVLQGSQKVYFPDLIDCLKRKLSSRRDISLKGCLTKITGKDGFDSHDPIIRCEKFNHPFILKYNQQNKKLFISEKGNHMIKSIQNITMCRYNEKNRWSIKLEAEVGQPGQEGYSNGDKNTCKLKYPRGFDWDLNDNMYICNETCVCKVDGISNQVSLIAGHGTESGYRNGCNDEARFDGLTGILCYQQRHQDDTSQSSLISLFVCDYFHSCIRLIDVTNYKTMVFAGENEDYDMDGTLQSARFCGPWDIVRDDENEHILYVSDSGNHKIKMINLKKGMVTTLVGDMDDTSILNKPLQMQVIDFFIYVSCYNYKDCIVKIDKNSKQVTKIKFNHGKQVSNFMLGITYHELDQCFYISDTCNIYKLE